MEITDVKVRKVTGEGRLKAYVTLTFDDCFVVHNVKVIEGKEGLIIAMPSRKTRTGEYRDVVHPTNSAFRAVVQEKVMDKYNSPDCESAIED